MVRFDVLHPQTILEACSLLSEHKNEARVLAGGQNLLVLLRHRSIKPRYVVNIKGLSQMAYIKDEADSIKIGALTTHRTLETSALIKEKLPMLAELEHDLGCIQTRNWGTIGGNLCQASPSTDLAPALIALKARAKLISVRGERVESLDNFFIDYQKTCLDTDEILAEIQVPQPLPDTGVVYYKEAVRLADPPFASVAAVIRLNIHGEVIEARIVLQAVGVTPIRAREAEDTLTGNKGEDRLLEKVAALATKAARPISDIYGSADYKLQMVKVLTRRTVKEAIRRAVSTRR